MVMKRVFNDVKKTKQKGFNPFVFTVKMRLQLFYGFQQVSL